MLRTIVLPLLVLACAAIATLYLQDFNQGSLNGTARVIDADTLIVNEERVRLWGIDAPEWNQTCGTPRWSCGQKATAHMRGLVAGRSLDCVTFGRDKYQRMLATCSVGSLNIAADLVKNGFAVATGDYFDLENVARRAQRNIWSGPFETPAQWRQKQRQEKAGEGGSFLSDLFAHFGRKE